MRTHEPADDGRARNDFAALLVATAVASAASALATVVLFSSHPAVLAAAAAAALALAWAAHAMGSELAAFLRAHVPSAAARAWAHLGVPVPVRLEAVVAAGFACIAGLAALKLSVLVSYALELRVAEYLWPAGAAAVRRVVSGRPGGLIYIHAW